VILEMWVVEMRNRPTIFYLTTHITLPSEGSALVVQRSLLFHFTLGCVPSSVDQCMALKVFFYHV